MGIAPYCRNLIIQEQKMKIANSIARIDRQHAFGQTEPFDQRFEGRGCRETGIF